MTLLPIVDRELRVAARRKVTWWGRLAAAGFGLLIFGLLQTLFLTAGAGAAVGQTEFAVLKWMAFLFAGCSGIFLTADAISEEKREGTLGLLFLTDLHGHDVIFGKLLSHSLQGFYALLAAFPVLALPLLAGGLSMREFTLSMVVIVNTLLFSLSLGLLISTVSRDYIKAMSATVLACLIFYLVLAVVDLAIANAGQRPVRAFFGFASPGWLLAETGAYSGKDFWRALGIQHALAWGFLLLAAVLVPRVWQEKAGVAGASRSTVLNRWRFGGAQFRMAWRRRWLEVGPVHWLALRDRWLPRLTRLLTLLVVGLQGCNLLGGFLQYHYGGAGSSFNIFSGMAAGFQYLFSIGLTLWVAAKASQIFIDATRTGALELLLVTPVTPRAIVQAQWNALCRTFLLPAVCIIGLQVASGVLTLLEANRSFAAMPAVSVPATNGVTGISNNIVTTNTTVVTTSSSTTITYSTTTPNLIPGFVTYQLVSVLLGAAMLPAGMASVAWFGMWMGLNNRKISAAVLKTVCFVYVLPWIIYAFLYGFTAVLFMMAASRLAGRGGTGLSSAYGMLLLSSVIGGVFNLGKDAFFIWWARGRLLTRLRGVAAGEGKLRRVFIPPVPENNPPPRALP